MKPTIFMSHFTFKQLNEQLPLYRDFNRSISRDERTSQDPLQKNSYQISISDCQTSFSTQNFSWEYYSNELEFE